MRYILYNPLFTDDNPFFRISEEGATKEQLVPSFNKRQLDDQNVVYLNNLVLTDLDTFFVISLPLQKRIVRECLDEERSSEETILPF